MRIEFENFETPITHNFYKDLDRNFIEERA